MTEPTIFAATIEEIAQIMHDESRGELSLVGDRGGLSRITGPIEPSSFVFGAVSVETEHGTLFFDTAEVLHVHELTQDEAERDALSQGVRRAQRTTQLSDAFDTAPQAS